MDEELSGAELDAAVALALGLPLREPGTVWAHLEGARSLPGSQGDPEPWRPSTNWSVGGPLIERHRISLRNQCDMSDPLGYWVATAERWHPTNPLADPPECFGPTPLIAAMRALVAAKALDKFGAK